jgi:hypothetical protein
MNDDSIRDCKEEVICLIKALSRNMTAGTEEIHEEPRSG